MKRSTKKRAVSWVEARDSERAKRLPREMVKIRIVVKRDVKPEKPKC